MFGLFVVLLVLLACCYAGYRVWLLPMFLRMEAGLVEQKRQETARSYAVRDARRSGTGDGVDLGAR